MTIRAKSSGIRLDDFQASVVKAMLERGDRQSDIAAFFGVNPGRIAEINTGEEFSWVTPTKEELPPPGPYKIEALWLFIKTVAAFHNNELMDEIDRDISTYELLKAFGFIED